MVLDFGPSLRQHLMRKICMAREKCSREKGYPFPPRAPFLRIINQDGSGSVISLVLLNSISGHLSKQ